MRDEEAIRSFIEAKQDLSSLTLARYYRALDYIKRESSEMPEKPEVLRRALNQVKSVWARDSLWRVWKVFFRWCYLEYGIPNTMERVQRPRLPNIELRALEPGELAALLQFAEATLQDNSNIRKTLQSLSDKHVILIINPGPDQGKEFNMPAMQKLRELYQKVSDESHMAPDTSQAVHEMEAVCLEIGADPL
jgi:hypothetical protein